MDVILGLSLNSYDDTIRVSCGYKYGLVEHNKNTDSDQTDTESIDPSLLSTSTYSLV